MSDQEVEMIEERSFVGGDTNTFGVEVQPSWVDEGRWEITLWRNRSGNPRGQVSIADRQVAVDLAQHIYDTLLPEFEQQNVVQAERHARQKETMSAEHAKRRVEEKRARRRRLAKITPETPTVERIKCPECDYVGDPDEFDEPAYECSRCSRVARGEDGRRCDQCHIFCAKVAECSCPSCEAPLEDNTEPETVLGYEVDGEFIPVGEAVA